MARDYSKGKIYKIMVNTVQEYLPYVGSTTKQYLSQRMERHRTSYKQWKKNGNSFISSFTLFDRFGVENCYIELLELCPCSCSDELRKKEREWIEKIESVNIVKRVIITKEEKIEYHKEYHAENREKMLEKGKINWEKNKNKYNEKRKIKYENIKNELLEKRKEKYTCDCGSTLRKSDKSTHERSQKHQLFIQQS